MSLTSSGRSLSCVTLIMVIQSTIVCCQSATNELRTSKVHFSVFDEFGPQPYRVVRFADKTTGRDYAQLFKGLDANKIPYGQYAYVLERSDIRNTKLSTIRGGLYVYHLEHWLELNPSGNYGSSTRGDEVILELGGPPEVNIVGVVAPVPRSSDPVRVRLQAVHTRDRVEAEVGTNGEFHIYDVLLGWYVVIVLEGDKVIHTEPLFVADPNSLQKLVIRLNDREH
jgi:hypothetical protein